jgi:hypothetical protein
MGKALVRCAKWLNASRAFQVLGKQQPDKPNEKHATARENTTSRKSRKAQKKTSQHFGEKKHRSNPQENTTPHEKTPKPNKSQQLTTMWATTLFKTTNTCPKLKNIGAHRYTRGGPGSIPGAIPENNINADDSEGIRTPAGRAQWISSPSP